MQSLLLWSQCTDQIGRGIYLWSSKHSMRESLLWSLTQDAHSSIEQTVYRQHVCWLFLHRPPLQKLKQYIWFLEVCFHFVTSVHTEQKKISDMTHNPYFSHHILIVQRLTNSFTSLTFGSLYEWQAIKLLLFTIEQRTKINGGLTPGEHIQNIVSDICVPIHWPWWVVTMVCNVSRILWKFV